VTLSRRALSKFAGLPAGDEIGDGECH
jgi:hypothetical protein